MTPDESLQALRAALAVLIPRRDSLLAIMGTDYKRDELDELIDAAASLDVWLSKGGWLPAAWSQRTEMDLFPDMLARYAQGIGVPAGEIPINAVAAIELASEQSIVERRKELKR